MYKIERTFSAQQAPLPPRPGDGFECKGEKYVVCGAGKCAVDHDDNQIWCVNEKGCPRPDHPNDPCHCLLIRVRKSLSRRKTDAPKWEIDPDEPTWDAQRQQARYPYDPESYWYAALCARKL